MRLNLFITNELLIISTINIGIDNLCHNVNISTNFTYRLWCPNIHPRSAKPGQVCSFFIKLSRDKTHHHAKFTVEACLYYINHQPISFVWNSVITFHSLFRFDFQVRLDLQSYSKKVATTQRPNLSFILSLSLFLTDFQQFT